MMDAFIRAVGFRVSGPRFSCFWLHCLVRVKSLKFWFRVPGFEFRFQGCRFWGPVFGVVFNKNVKELLTCRRTPTL